MDFENIFLYTFVISNIMLCSGIDSTITKIEYEKRPHLKEKSYRHIKKDTALEIESSEDNSDIMSKEDEPLKMSTPFYKDTTSVASETHAFEAASKEGSTTTPHLKNNIDSSADKMNCTCGIFLGSQFVKGSSEPPKGDPIISTTLDRSFVCNPIGQKQCQTKCLKQIIQHLPNSANILCATLDRDIHKENAFLFIRNCNSKWHNTNLAAGREYCCKNGIPYNCPKNN